MAGSAAARPLRGPGGARPRDGRSGGESSRRATAEGDDQGSGSAPAARAAQPRAGLQYFRFHSSFPHPRPAALTYTDRPPGQGWPEQCPPMRAAQAFGWDVVNPFDIDFVFGHDGWELTGAVEVDCGDLRERSGVKSFDQDNVWPWDPEQVLPHKISPHVFPEIKHQVKVSTYLYLWTPPGWSLLMTDVPNSDRRFRVLSAMLETDWYYPAHPWHCVLELPKGDAVARGDTLKIAAGEPLCRLMPVRRGSYAAKEMRPEEMASLYRGGQRWLAQHGRASDDPSAPAGALDIRGAFKREQQLAKFAVLSGSPRAEERKARGKRGRARR